MERVVMKAQQLPNGQWVAGCERCGITNKLAPHPDEPDRFSISGGFFNIAPDDKK